MRKLTHTLGGSAAPSKISCSEVTSEAIFVLKFIFGLNATRTPGRVFLELRLQSYTAVGHW